MIHSLKLLVDCHMESLHIFLVIIHLYTYFCLLLGLIPGYGDTNNHDSIAAFLLNRLIHKHNLNQALVI